MVVVVWLFGLLPTFVVLLPLCPSLKPFRLRGMGQHHRFFEVWLGMPSLYWPWPAMGATVTGLAFYAVQMARTVRWLMPR